MPEAQINPRYSKYSNKEIEAILDSVAQVDQTPVEDSPYPVSSGSVAKGLAGKQAALYPVDINTLTPQSTFRENSLIGFNGVLFRSTRATEDLPYTLVTESGRFVYHEIDGCKAFVIAGTTLNDGWEVFTDAGLDYRTASISASLAEHAGNAVVHVTTAERSAWNAKQEAIGDIDTIRANASKGATAVHLTDTVTVGTRSYTVQALLNAVASLMEKTIVTKE